MPIKYVFVVGGVMSGVGKGVAAAAIGKILQSRGFRVTAVKIDPYVNVDAGTMNPTEHGEVFVLDDGTECDQDMGNYERFLNQDLSGVNYMTTGSVYQSVINKERNLEYGGRCVEVVPHISLEVINKIRKAAAENKAEIIITEIGGTVGEYQNILFLEAVRILKTKQPDDILLVLVSYLPLLNRESELKTKPTQYAARTLNSAGLQPDIILARAATFLDEKRKEKIAFNCSLQTEDIISAPDIESIYEVPLNFEKDNLSGRLLKKLELPPRGKDLRQWRRLIQTIKNNSRTITVGLVGKYFTTGQFILTDAYISVIEAIKHASFSLGRKPVIKWLDAEEYEKNPANLKKLSDCDGIIIPGGFGQRGAEGKMAAIGYCRRKKIPFLGLCYGMQLAVIEFSRSSAGLKKANSTEIDSQTPQPVIDILPEQQKNLADKKYGASMRLGAYPAALVSETIAWTAYKQPLISERHRHRYEVNPDFVNLLKEKGLIFSGCSPDGRLMEILELSRQVHPFFVAVQFHPEFKSRPLRPHPLFKEFIKAATNKK